MRCSIVYAGGTWGQTMGNDRFLHPPRSANALGKACRVLIREQRLDSEFDEFNFVVFDTIDSTNRVPADWGRLVQIIAREIDQGSHAVIVGHGTDSLAETSAAVKFGLLGKDFDHWGLYRPVVFFGSQSHFGAQLPADAKNNFVSALKVARRAIELRIADVLVTFGPSIFRACDAMKISEVRFNAFAPAIGRPVGEILSGDLVELYPEMLKQTGQALGKFQPAPHFTGWFEQFTIRPGSRPKALELLLDSDVDGVLLTAMGAGNVPTRRGYDFAAVIRKFADRQKPVVLVSPYHAGKIRPLYEGAKAALDAGVVSAGDTPAVSAWPKLFWGHGIGMRTRDQVDQLFRTCLGGENGLPDRRI